MFLLFIIIGVIANKRNKKYFILSINNNKKRLFFSQILTLKLHIKMINFGLFNQ